MTYISPPFSPGDRIVSIANLQSGQRIVTCCYQYPDSSWQVDWQIHNANNRPYIAGSIPAADFILAPPNWRDPPPLPASRFEYSLMYDNQPLIYREITDPGRLETVAQRAAAYRALALWNDEVASFHNDKGELLFSLYDGAEKAEGYRALADQIEQEEGTAA